jgi:hypothetical protein
MPLQVQQILIRLLLQKLWMRAFAREALHVPLQSDARMLSQVRVKQNVKAFANNQRVQQHALVELVRAVFKHGVHLLLKSLKVDRQLGVLLKGPLAASEDHAKPEVLHRNASLVLPLPLLRVVLAVGHLT